MSLTEPLPVNPEIHLPTTLDWYRQTATWLVSLATGALTIGIATADKIPMDTPWQKIVLSLGVIAFLVSVGSGILFYFWITSYANHLERRDKYACFYKTELDAAKQANYLNEHELADCKATKAASQYSWSFNIMLLSFVGAVFFLVLLLASLLIAKQPLKPPKLTVFTQTNASGNQTFMMDENTGNTWVLTPDTAHTLVWKQILIPEQPVATTTVRGKK